MKASYEFPCNPADIVKWLFRPRRCKLCHLRHRHDL